MGDAVVANREELARFDEEEAVLHGVGVTLGLSCDFGEVGFQLGEASLGGGEQGEKFGCGGGERGAAGNVA